MYKQKRCSFSCGHCLSVHIGYCFCSFPLVCFSPIDTGTVRFHHYWNKRLLALLGPRSKNRLNSLHTGANEQWQLTIECTQMSGVGAWTTFTSTTTTGIKEATTSACQQTFTLLWHKSKAQISSCALTAHSYTSLEIQKRKAIRCSLLFPQAAWVASIYSLTKSNFSFSADFACP